MAAIHTRLLAVVVDGHASLPEGLHTANDLREATAPETSLSETAAAHEQARCMLTSVLISTERTTRAGGVHIDLVNPSNMARTWRPGAATTVLPCQQVNFPAELPYA